MKTQPYFPPQWRLERRVPLALVIGIVAQFLSVVIWATYLEARVSTLETEQRTMQGISEKFARLEERIDAVRSEIVLMRRALERR